MIVAERRSFLVATLVALSVCAGLWVNACGMRESSASTAVNHLSRMLHAEESVAYEQILTELKEVTIV